MTKYIAFIILLLISVVACSPQEETTVKADNDETVSTNYSEYKVLVIDSYHEGYDWSDGTEAGLRSVLDGTGIDIKVLHMDTKRNSDSDFRGKCGIRGKSRN